MDGYVSGWVGRWFFNCKVGMSRLMWFAGLQAGILFFLL